MSQARDRKDYEVMARICKQAVERGDTSEHMLRSWSWALCRLGRTEEAVPIAQRNWELNRGAWSLVQLTEAYADNGQMDLAVEMAKLLQRYPSEWGSAAGAARHVIGRLSSTTYQFTWSIAAPVGSKASRRRIVIPQQDAYVQKHVQIGVAGSEEWSFKTTVDGVRYLEIVQQPGEAVKVTSEVTFCPHSWKPFLKKFDASAPLPVDAEALLGISKEGDFLGVDPTSPQVKKLAAQLRGGTDIQTVENIMNFISRQVPWTDVPGRLNSEDCLKLRKGSCTPRSLAAAALFRANGIPARLIRGHSGVAPDRVNPGPHTIPQFYLRGIGWVDSDFDGPIWEPRVNYLRMYYRASRDYGLLGDAVDPKKDCSMRVLRVAL